MAIINNQVRTCNTKRKPKKNTTTATVITTTVITNLLLFTMFCHNFECLVGKCCFIAQIFTFTNAILIKRLILYLYVRSVNIFNSARREVINAEQNKMFMKTTYRYANLSYFILSGNFLFHTPKQTQSVYAKLRNLLRNNMYLVLPTNTCA